MKSTANSSSMFHSKRLKTAGKNILRNFGVELRRLPRKPGTSRFCEVQADQIGACSESRPPNRVLVITQPKAGTYLFAEILKQVGFTHTYMHLGLHRMQAYEPYCLNDGLQNPAAFNVRCPITESRNLIRLGQVAVSHAPYRNEFARLFAGFRIIHVKRDLRKSFVSRARMYLHSETKGSAYRNAIRCDGASGLMMCKGKEIIAQALNINQWSKCKNVLSLKMENLTSNPERTIELMLSHVGTRIEEDPCSIWARSRDANTLTKSEKFPRMNWTNEDEAVFRDIGGIEANQLLGYE